MNGIARRSLTPNAACLLVVVIVGVFWAPMIVRSNLMNWHIQTAYTQAQLCDWPAWEEGFSTMCTNDGWFYRTLERRAIKLPSTLWVSGVAHTLRWGPLFYGGLWALHVVSAALVLAIALHSTGRAGLALLAGLLFGLHPAAAEVVVTGQFPQYAFGGCFSLLALWIALRGGPGPAFMGALVLACSSDVTFLATPVIVLLWVDDRRRFLPMCAAVLVLASAAYGVHAWLHPSLRHHHVEFLPVSFGDRLLRMLVVEPVLALRRSLLLWSLDAGPWFSNPRTDEFEGLGPLEPVALAGLAAIVVAAAWLARRDRGALVRLGALPIALLLVDVSMKAGWSDIFASRWSGLRHVYLPSAFLALMIAWCLRGAERTRRIAVAGAAVLLWSASLSWRLAEHTWTRMHDDHRALLAAADELEPLAIAPDATAYLFEVVDTRPFVAWQGALRDRVGEARFTVVSYGEATNAPTQLTRTGPRELELELCAACADFLRPEQQPAWARPLGPSQRFAAYVRRGGQLNMWPIFDPGVLEGRRVPLPGVQGADVRVLSIAPGQPVRLALRTRHALDDPRTVLLVEQRDGWARVSCPLRGPCQVAP